jgi:hypothetical protein
MPESNEIEEIVLTRLVRLNATVHGIVTGLIVGSGVFIATNWLILKGGDTVGPHLSLLSQFFLGYRVTFVGSLIGFCYGFLSGFAVGSVVAILYNWIVTVRDGKAQA